MKKITGISLIGGGLALAKFDAGMRGTPVSLLQALSGNPMAIGLVALGSYLLLSNGKKRRKAK